MTEELQIKLTTDLSGFTKGLDKAMRSVDKMGQKLTKAGKTMSVAFTAPLAVIGGTAVAAYDTQIKAERRLASAIAATGSDAQQGLKDFMAYASELQRVTNVGDESTLAMLTLATQMGLNADQAKIANNQALGLADAFGMNAQQAMRMAAALQQGDTQMLTRYVPALRGVESETEKVRIATEFADNAFQTFADTAQEGTGPLKALQGNFGDLLEQFGEIITEAINPFITGLSDMVLGFQKMDKGTKQIIVVLGALLAALGPILVGFGFMATTILPQLVAGLALIASPIGLLVISLGALAAGLAAFNLP